MKFVLDASAAVMWQLGEPGADRVNELIQLVRLGTHKLIVPDFSFVECGHAFFRAERSKRIVSGDARKMLLALAVDYPTETPSRPLLPRASAICQHIRKGLYDCVYMALAERESVDMLTADEKLLIATRGHYPFVKSLDDLP